MTNEETVSNWYNNKTLVIILLIFLYPIGWFAMYKGDHFSKKTRKITSWILIFWTLILVFGDDNSVPSPPYDQPCDSVIQEGNCTYYRDSSCNVIARDCQ